MSIPANIRHGPWDLILIVLLAAAVRLVMLDLKAPHFDEGVNGWFADQLRETGTFRYTPDNFHGPWHFYTVFVSQELLGRNLWALRLPAVIAGLLTIPALFLFARWFGRSTVRWAALAWAVSPAATFYTRYSIHEPWFVLFTIVFTWGVIALWLERDRAGLWASALGLTGMILNKETYLIHAGSLALAAPVFLAWTKISPLSPPLERAHSREWMSRNLVAATTAAIFLLVFFYSGNFFHPQGLLGPFKAMVAWTHTGTDGQGHVKDAYDLLPLLNYYWLALLARYEWPALLGLLWSLRYAWPAPAAPRLLAILGAGVLLAYSLVPYKTPWCLLAILWPWFLFFGLAITALPRRAGLIIGTLLILASLAASARLNFFYFEDDREPFVYVQTYRDVDKFTGLLTDGAARDPRILHTRGGVYLASYYPLPWILGDFTRIGYYGDGVPEPLPAADFHVIETARAESLRRQLGADFLEIRFQLRSGMGECSAFVSKQLLQQITDTPAPRRPLAL